MSNNLEGNPLIIDTAFSAAEVTRFSGLVKVVKADWHEPTAADDLTIIDNASRTIWDDNAVAGGSGINLPAIPEGTYNGFNVSVIDGGTLYVYIK